MKKWKLSHYIDKISVSWICSYFFYTHASFSCIKLGVMVCIIFIHVFFFQVMTRTVYFKHFLLNILEVSSPSQVTLFLVDLCSSLVKNLHLPVSGWCNIPLVLKICCTNVIWWHWIFPMNPDQSDNIQLYVYDRALRKIWT